MKVLQPPLLLLIFCFPLPSPCLSPLIPPSFSPLTPFFTLHSLSFSPPPLFFPPLHIFSSQLASISFSLSTVPSIYSSVLPVLLPQLRGLPPVLSTSRSFRALSPSGLRLIVILSHTLVLSSSISLCCLLTAPCLFTLLRTSLVLLKL